MTVAYRMCRDRPNAATAADISRLAFRCEILESFQARWWSAEAMARLGRKALQNIQRVPRVGGKEQSSLAAAQQPHHDKNATNPLEMLSTVAESHGNGSLPIALPDTPEEATGGSCERVVSNDQPVNTEAYPFDGAITLDSYTEVERFRDLDTAFGDFFDLSLPTSFFDPLFEGIEAFDFSDLPE
jgi:hypothetical protein